MTHVLYRHNVATDLPEAVAGDGPYLIDASGKRYLDASCGAAVSCLGHSNIAVREAIKKQVDQIAYAHTRFFTNGPMEQLADELVDGAPDGISRVWFTCGGSEAIEAALKITRQYFVEKGEPQRRYVIGRLQGYHGNTVGALSVSGNVWRRSMFEPVLLSVTHHVSPCFAYRDMHEGETESEYGLRVANELEEKILALGADTVAAFVAETVVGSTLGAVPAVPGYFKRVREICDKYGVLLILDEVMCGMGRTGTRYACEQEGIAPDFIALAKGLAGGYLPLGALLMNEKIYDVISRGSNVVMHGHTFMGHATSCAAGLAVQNEIKRQNLLENVRRQGQRLRSMLEERFADHPHVGDIRGRGLFLAVEFVADRESRATFDPGLKINARIKEVAFGHGLICYPMGGIVEGKRGDHVMLAPPFIVNEDHLQEMVDKLQLTVDEVLRNVARMAA